MLATTTFLRSVFVENLKVWEACTLAFTSSSRTLQHSPVVLIFRQGDTVESKTMVYSEPKTAVWGIKPVCKNPTCESQIGDVFTKTHKTHKTGNALSHIKASWVCKRCQKKTQPFDRPSWIEEVPDRRHYFVYDYPFDEKLERLVDSLVWY